MRTAFEIVARAAGRHVIDDLKSVNRKIIF